MREHYDSNSLAYAIGDCDPRQAQREREASSAKRAATQKESQISLQVQIQDKESDRLGELLTQLVDRLSGVILERPAGNKSDGTPSEPLQLCPLASKLHEQSQRTNQFANRIEYILSVLEV